MSRGRLVRVAVSSAAVVVGGAGQALALPLLLAALGNSAGSYVTFVMLCLAFVLIFALATLGQYLAGGLRGSDLAVNDGAFALIGLCDCLNGLLTVFCSALDRTPGPLQAILPQLAIPFTVLLSYSLYKVALSRQQGIGAGLVVLGVVLTMVPSFVALSQGGKGASNPLYAGLFALGVVPGVLTNVLQTGIYRRHPGFNKMLFLLYRSSYQAVFALVLFWTDLLPVLGTSLSLGDMGEHINYGVTCLMRPPASEPRCGDAWWLGVLFTAAYCSTYWAGAVVIEAASANYVALLSTANTPLAAIVWFAAPALTVWAGGTPSDGSQLAWGLAALFLLIVPGSLVYKLAEAKKQAPLESALALATPGGMAGPGTRAGRGGASAAAPLLGPGSDAFSLTADLGGSADARVLRLLALQRAIEQELGSAASTGDDARLMVYVR